QGDGDRAVPGAEVQDVALLWRRGRLFSQPPRAEGAPPGAEDPAVGLQDEVQVRGLEPHRPRAGRDLRASFEVMGFGYTHRSSPSRLMPPGIKPPFGETFANHPAVGPSWSQGGPCEV